MGGDPLFGTLYSFGPGDGWWSGGGGPVVGMCGLFPSLLMDCVDVWLDGWMGLADELLLILIWLVRVCVVCEWSWSVCRLAEWLSSLNVRLSLADIQCEWLAGWLAGRSESTIGSME